MEKIKENVSAMARDKNGKKWEDYETIKMPNGHVINMVTLINEQAKAKAALTHLEPMFATFANRLEVVYTFHVPTQATDGFHLFVNPAFTEELTFEQKVFVMAHECMHCVLDHMRRGIQAGHEHERSNIAADYEVNDTLIELGLFKESTIKAIGALVDKKYTNWSYEKIYDANPPGPSKKQDGNKGQQGQQGQQGGGGNDQQQHGPDYIAGWNKAMADYKAGKLKI